MCGKADHELWLKLDKDTTDNRGYRVCVCAHTLYTTSLQTVFHLKDGLSVFCTAPKERIRIKGLKEQRRDLCLVSEDFSNSTWNKLPLKVVSSPSSEAFKHNQSFWRNVVERAQMPIGHLSQWFLRFLLSLSIHEIVLICFQMNMLQTSSPER